MIIYPAIDIKNGKCVRLIQGRVEEQTIYYENPVDAAVNWVEQGAEFLHVVDLDGALYGQSTNIPIIREIVRNVAVPVQLGGGIRDMDRINFLLEELGVSRVITGTSAVESPELIKKAAARYGDRIAVGIDAKNGKVAIKGWVEQRDISAVQLGKTVGQMGINTIIYTDISRDGMMTGPNLRSIGEMIKGTGLDIIASGGISTIKDIKDVFDTGAAGVIIGKALYTGTIKLEEAVMIKGRLQEC